MFYKEQQCQGKAGGNYLCEPTNNTDPIEKYAQQLLYLTKRRYYECD